jgi:ATP-dependent exoDNAse (exonuclease V) beta subunit
MPDAPRNSPPLDQAERERALDARRSILVRAPAGSGKTDLLTRRFLLLLGIVDDPREIVAITFTKAAAAEMRHRILSELEKAAAPAASPHLEESGRFSMQTLAQRALSRSQALGWNLLDLPTQLRIQTIDSFSRELALQQPLLSGLGGGLDIVEKPAELYRRAARRTLEQIDGRDPALRQAIEHLLLWRDNSWQDVEDQIVAMLARRDQWMQDFLFDRDPDWDLLREQLERPFARHVRSHLALLDRLFAQAPGARDEALSLAQFACRQCEGTRYQALAELAEFPDLQSDSLQELEAARESFACVADLLLTQDGAFRKQVNIFVGFPRESKAEKMRFSNLVESFSEIETFESALAAVASLPPARYTDEEWAIVKASFTLLRHAVGQLQVVFAEAASADYIEVARIALNVLKGESDAPLDATLAATDRARHLLVDEFQDTSRRQHQLFAYLIRAWPDREGRTCFVVGDPMQSIYFFRDADAELFPRVERLGLEIPDDQPLLFEPAVLTANFRTAAPLIEQINDAFEQVFAFDDGSGIRYAEAHAVRSHSSHSGIHLVGSAHVPLQLHLEFLHDLPLRLHLEFMPDSSRGSSNGADSARKEETASQRKAANQKQIDEIVAFIRDRQPQINAARATGEKYRIAVLGRARNSLEPIAQALREAEISFRAVDLEDLKQRPEIIDALALARALLNPHDRVAWLGLLRAPWCGLSLADLHALSSADDRNLCDRPIPELLPVRRMLLTDEGREAVDRILAAIDFASRLRAEEPAAPVGTWIEQVWIHLGGAQCIDAAARANLLLLWSALDGLPRGEPDILGPTMDAALRDLKALPDPAASSDCGVQLMTIHGAKGLEFEIVIVPDLQAPAGNGKLEMLSWLERGIPPDSDSPSRHASITELLVAPFQRKGAERGKAKLWVDRQRRNRELQEARRLLYVACTRARDELHLFARPSFKTADDGSLVLCEPSDSLLKTAWPAFEVEIRRQFDSWRASSGSVSAAAPPSQVSVEIASIAASIDGDLFETLPPAKPTLLRRLPSGFRPASVGPSFSGATTAIVGTDQLYERHEGGLLSRALGKAVHSLLQHLAQSRVSAPLSAACAALPALEPRIAADVRAIGVDPTHASRIARQATEIALKAAADPLAQWILSPHQEAASEVRWSGVVDGDLRTVQIDRVFLAGRAPQSSPASTGAAAWWIVDYKTAHDDSFNRSAVLPELRRIFAPQIEAYARILRNLHGVDAPVFGGLYYPRMSLFDWWPL